MHRARIAALVLAAGFTGIVSAQTPTWKAELLGTPPPDWSSLIAAVAVNDGGRVVGITYLSGYKRGWVVGPDHALELLPLPAGATYSQVNDLDASGVVVGSVLLSDGTSRGVLWKPRPGGYEVVLLPSHSSGTFPFDARGINERGDVVGKLGILGGSYHWSAATGVTQIPTSMFPKVPTDVNEQRQIVGGDYRMDLDTLVLEHLGNPTGTSYNYVYTELGRLNDIGECVGYAVVATSLPPYLPVRYTDDPGDEPVWKVFSNFPLNSASALGIAASGDTVFQLGIYGIYVYVNGVGSIGLQSTLDPAYASWDLTDSFSPAISRGGRLACTGVNDANGQGGIVLLTPLAFEDLGGGSPGALGIPVLSGYGSLASGQPTRLRLASASPNRAAYLAWARDLSAPMGAVYPKRIVEIGTDELGRFDLTFSWPFAPPGETVYLQAFVFDPAARLGMARSNILEAVTQ